MKKFFTFIFFTLLLFSSCEKSTAALTVFLPENETFTLTLQGRAGLKITVEDVTDSYTFTPLEEGIYRLICTKRGNEHFQKSIRIHEGINSIAISLDGFLEPGLIISDGSASPIKGKIEVYEIDKTNNSITLTYSPEHLDDKIDKSQLRYLWYKDGKYYSEGEYITLDMEKGIKRIDIVIETERLGALGSSSFVFY